MNKNIRNEIIIFLLLIIIVTCLHLVILKPILELGMSPDDWALFFDYKSLGNNPLFKIMEIWRRRGAYTTHQVLYIGILESLAGFSYYSFQVANILLRLFATLSVYPIIRLLSKRSSLAFFTTVFYSMAYSSTGSFEFVVKGTDYLGIFLMNIFFLLYYYLVKKRESGIKYLLIVSTCLFVTVFAATIRIFPLLAFLFLVEIGLIMFQGFSLKKITLSAKRLAVMFAPYLLAVAINPAMILGFAQTPRTIFDSFFDGNWHLLLAPFSGMGHTLLPNDYWRTAFGVLYVDNLNKYLKFLLGGPLIIFLSVTLLLAITKFKRNFKLGASVFLLNFSLQVCFYYLVNNYLRIADESKVAFDVVNVYPVLIGLYVLVLACFSFLRWRKNTSDSVLLLMWLGPLFAYIFITLTWLFAPFGTQFSSTSYYLTVATLGTAMFVGSLFTSVIDFLKKIRFRRLSNYMTFLFGLSVSTFLIVMNYQQVSRYFKTIIVNGRSARDQTLLQSQVKTILEKKNVDYQQPFFVYFDTSFDPLRGRTYEEALLSPFRWVMHFDDGELINGCMEDYYLTRKELADLVVDDGIQYRAFCFDDEGKGFREVVYKPINIYAFKLKDKKVIDITDEVLKEIGLKAF